MKKIIIFLLFLGFESIATAQYFQATLKIDLTTTGPEAVFYIKGSGGDITDGWTGVEFFITFPSSYSLTFGTPVVNTTDFPGLTITDGGLNVMGTALSGNDTEWFYFSGTATTSHTYTSGSEYEVFRVPITSSSVDFGDVSLEYDGSGYTTYLTLTGSIGTGYTTVDQNLNVPVYYGPGSYTGDNGNVIATGGSCMYTIYDQPLIPMVLFDNAVWLGGSGTGNSPGTSDGSKKCYVKDIGAQVVDASANVLDLIIETGGTLEIVPNAGLTATGNTTITDATSLTIKADATGVGSFIDNGTISYGTSGTAKVQTYLSNTAPSGSFNPHLIGPTVNITGTGVLLGDFNVNPGQTYAYEWLEPSGVWHNLVPVNTPVPTAKGIDLSIDDGSVNTLNMTGKLKTGNVSSETMTTGGTGNGNILLSNPYPSAIFWNDMYSDNSSNVNDVVYVWSGVPTSAGGSGNYKSYNTTSGGTGGFTGYLQVGQGFFVESTTSVNSFVFYNTQRHHSNDAFYSPRSFTNRLDVQIDGAGYSDGLLLHFYEGASTGFNPNEDVEKMYSFYDVAPEIWTVFEDSSKLSINALPESLLTRGLVSIPMSFKCGYDDEYTLDFSGLETFDNGTEVWLEDLKEGGDWVSINENPEYTFTASPDDDQNRFIIHFFGVTGVDQNVALDPVQIYGYGQYVYVVNIGDEPIENVFIYNMSGSQVVSTQVPDQKVNKIWVDNKLSYYIVRVVTDERVYTKKVLISYY